MEDTQGRVAPRHQPCGKTMIEGWRERRMQGGRKWKTQVELKKRGNEYEKRAREQGCDEECTNFLAGKLKNVTLF